MFSIRRYVVLATIVAFFLLILNLNSSGRSTSRIHYSNWLPGFKSKGPFRWADVPVNYPVSSLSSLPVGTPKRLPKIQFDFPPESPEHAAKQKERQAAVRQTFERCWTAYREHAWAKDELTPVSGGFRDSFGGWGATLVNSLDTLHIMGFETEFQDAVKAVAKIDLGTATTEAINVFETTIRHLGGLLSAYDLSGDAVLLEKAQDFGEMLLKAFDTPNRMPITRWEPQKALGEKQEAGDVVLTAEIGSLTMEFTRLSQLTGDMRWYDAANRISQIFAAQQMKSRLPGLWPVVVNARDGDFAADTYFTMGAMEDSLYEYLPKMYLLLGGLDSSYAEMYSRSMATAIEHLLWKPMTPDGADILISGVVRANDVKHTELEPQGQHLVCFVGAMLALGGKMFNEPEHIKLGRKVTDGCIWAYRALPRGIMPEVFSMVPCASKTKKCAWDEKLWKKEVVKKSDGGGDADAIITNMRLPQGFVEIQDRRYMLRPEAIESVFVLYRITGDETLLDVAWEMFQSITAATETAIANAALADVTFTKQQLGQRGAPVQMNNMESFWTGETLKYFYLIFSDPSLISLDEWVFNTEAHPFKRLLPT